MKLTIRLENLEIDLGVQKLNIPSVADKVIDIPDTPVPFDTLFEGKSHLSHGIFDVIIKWGFKGAVGALQQVLIDDKDLDSTSQWSYINSGPSSHFDMFEAFLDGKEVRMTGRSGIIIERQPEPETPVGK